MLLRHLRGAARLHATAAAAQRRHRQPAGRRALVSTAAAAAGTGGEAAPRAYLITGSTDGIGRHTAVRLGALERGRATILVHGRSAQRVADAVAAVEAAGGRAKGFVADLSRLDDVRRLAAEVVAAQPAGLHAMVLNAGVYEEQRRTSADGFELTYAVNVLSPFLLAALLWRRVAERIVVTSSISASGSLDLSNLQQERGYSAHGAYSASKCCNQVCAFALARKLRQQRGGGGGGLKVATLDPGTVNTKMLLAGWGRIGIEVKDADNTLRLLTRDAATLADGGSYWVGGRESRPVAPAADERLQDALWELWEEQAGVRFFGDGGGDV